MENKLLRKLSRSSLDFTIWARQQSSTGDGWYVFALIGNICYRKQIRVDEIFLHENFTTTDNKANDIALLRLGKNQHQTEFVLKNPLDNSFVPRGKGWSFHFPAGLLTCWGLQSRRRCWPCLWWGENFVVYGEETILFSMARRKFYLSDKSVCSDEANSSVLKSF